MFYKNLSSPRRGIIAFGTVLGLILFFGGILFFLLFGLFLIDLLFGAIVDTVIILIDKIVVVFAITRRVVAPVHSGLIRSVMRTRPPGSGRIVRCSGSLDGKSGTTQQA